MILLSKLNCMNLRCDDGQSSKIWNYGFASKRGTPVAKATNGGYDRVLRKLLER